MRLPWWVAESDWAYRYQFDVAADVFDQPYIWLVCDGLDTLATVMLNGHLLGQTNNMFRQYRWDVKGLLQSGQAAENELLISFASPVQYITAREAERALPTVSHTIAGGPYLRKAPCQSGWDWGPKLPPIGIWKDIRLEGAHTARLAPTGVHLRQSHQDGTVTISAEITREKFELLPSSWQKPQAA